MIKGPTFAQTKNPLATSKKLQTREGRAGHYDTAEGATRPRALNTVSTFVKEPGVIPKLLILSLSHRFSTLWVSSNSNEGGPN